MNILQNRIDSFSNSSIQWPYLKKRYLQPDNLAKAGFYFMHKSDHVRCFLCDIELSEWKQGQSPYTRHINESPSCPLVLLQFPERSSRLIKNKAIAQPFDLTRRNARLATFNYHKYWPPHQRRKRSYPSVTKLADTGFYFSPTLDYIARVVCPYCKSAITEPDKSIDFLGRHREHCIFLDGTPDEIKGAITTDRRNTASSTSSVETYKTAGSGSSIMVS
ncbi:hypothetical protein BDF20DRAFT_529716 [Mycotypha africana]|uniref:uncharacterized protein n=1 Tax=Mycotypha africana TaxID=64632 RepID=UPI0023007763|nr:uncharacterized protein BDF20DRAFT_529716 [Mycotypha africana]KAI8979753.1 hypothetical protein BDF20DRAFT_529716 [Mycotypha africana]